MPTQINHQGVVSVNGQRFSGNGNFYFAIIDPVTGNSVWTNDATNIGTANRPNRPVVLPCVTGLYSVRLGDQSLPYMKLVPVGAFSFENRSLRIWFDDGINGVHQLTPDHALTSGPYAYRAPATKNVSNSRFFGDGSDGNVAMAVDTSLMRDQYYENLTIEPSVTLMARGHRIFVTDTLTLKGAIVRDGNNGLNGNSSSGSNGGIGGQGGLPLLEGGYLQSLAPGGSGGPGGNANSGGASQNAGAGTSLTSCLNTNDGANGGHGGATQPGNLDGGTGGPGGISTAAIVKLIANWHLETLIDIASTGETVKYSSSGTGGGGGGGSGSLGNNDGGGGGGGGGSNGGIIAVYARNIVIHPSGMIRANGGDGGNGGNGVGDGSNQGAVGGGGAGGNGGVIILAYETLANNGILQVNGGIGGARGTIGTLTQAENGSNGNDGAVYLFDLDE